MQFKSEPDKIVLLTSKHQPEPQKLIKLISDHSPDHMAVCFFKKHTSYSKL